MFKKILATALAFAVFGTVSLTAFAESGENSAQSVESAPKIEYIYSEIVENKIPSHSLYEEILAKQIVFYSNVSNGAVIDYPVELDLPDTVTVTLEKDGKKSEYKRGEPLEKPGKYSLTMMVDGKDLLGGNENEVYYGLFRFWITEASEEGESGDNSDDEDSDYSDFSEDESSDSSDVSGESDYSDTSSDGSDTSSDGSDTSSDSSGGEGEKPSKPDDKEPEEQGVLLPKNDKASLLSQYATSEKIRVVTDGGTEFYCNIPAGTITTNEVKFEYPDDIEYKLLKDGEEQTSYAFGNALTEKGEYTLLINDGDDENPAKFEFAIIGQYAGAITKYTVPDGCKIEKAMFGKSEIRANGNSVDLGKEGEYTFDISCGLYKWTESFTLDNTPPEFKVNGLDDEGKAQGVTVFIELISDDIDTYTIIKDGEPIRKSLELTDAGKYYVTVYDKAGNSFSQTFDIIYQMNAMAIVAVALGGALIIAGVVFFIITRKKFNIR